jgi:hypothetical protein
MVCWKRPFTFPNPQRRSAPRHFRFSAPSPRALRLFTVAGMAPPVYRCLNTTILRVKRKLESSPEVVLRGSSVSSRIPPENRHEVCVLMRVGSGSFIEFEDVGLLLGPEKMIIPPVNTPGPSESLPQWSPLVDLSNSQKNSIQPYLSTVICLANGKNDRKKVSVRPNFSFRQK